MDLNALESVYRPNGSIKHCYVVNITAEHGLFQAENPLTQALPLLAAQLATVILVCRAVSVILRPLCVPRIVADILGGILLGPTALLNIDFFSLMFPLRGVMLLETVAYWALSCHMFLIGLEIDVTALFRTSQKALHIAVTGVVIPFVGGTVLFFLQNAFSSRPYAKSGCFFWGLALAITGYPIVARVLADLKLFHTEVGRLAMSTSMVTDLICWALFVILSPFYADPKNAVFSIVTTTIFAVFCVYVVRPIFSTVIDRTSDGKTFSEYYLCLVLVSVSLFGSVTEVLGTSSIVGAFIFGLVMPNRVLAGVLLEKLEDFVSGYLMSLFFVACGIRINVWSIFGEDSNPALALIVVFLACSLKILSTTVAFSFHNLSRKEGSALGVIMNTKGILALVVLNMGFDRAFLSHVDYAVMAVAVLLMTGISGPVTGSMYRSGKRLSGYKRRTIQGVKSESEFRILACMHEPRNVSGIINLLDTSNGTKQSPLFVFGLHLVELTGRASAMLIVHTSGKTNSHKRNPQSEQIVSALETYHNLNDNVSIQPLTALSPFTTMHEDICSLAEDKHIALLILPFHKLPSSDGKLEEDANTSIRGVNLNVLANAPCTVGIFVDRGFGSLNSGESNLKMREIVMIFIGGPDDREALSYAWRMAGSHGVGLTVVRFLQGDKAEELFEQIDLPATVSVDTHKLLTSTSYMDRQKRLDDEYVNEFRLKIAEEQYIKYREVVANNDEDTISALKDMDVACDLYVVGRGEGIFSPLTAGLLDWCDYPELGPIGDLLVTSSFVQGSVLVVQKYLGAAGAGGADQALSELLSASSEGSQRGSDGFGSWRPSVSEKEDSGLVEVGPFPNKRNKDGTED